MSKLQNLCDGNIDVPNLISSYTISFAGQFPRTSLYGERAIDFHKFE